jgi:NADP-dependent 3-hydroxy acid dehydrogenase YdfG
VNIRGVLHGIAAVLPEMRARKSGQIINLSSIGGHQVWATCAVYSGTKFAVLAISEGLRLENTDVRVTVISPGVVESELADTISDQGTREAMAEFRKVALTPNAIARAIAYAIEQPADVDVNEIIVRPTAGAQ